MPPLNFQAPAGWNKWIYPRTSVSGIQLADAVFPPIYTPSKSFWLRSLITHCLVPWINTFDPLSAFLLGGGASGTIAGSVSGLSVVKNLYPIYVATGNFSLVGNAAGPQFGYCMGNSFKQHVYVRFDIQNALGAVVLMDNVVEYLENSRFKRIYVNHGNITDYRISEAKHILSLDINKSQLPPQYAKNNISNSGSYYVKITQPNGKKFSLKILALLDNWDIVVDTPITGDIPQRGDFYEMNKTWCIENPYLISGFWMGAENSLNNGTPASGLNLFATQHNKPYQEGKILGVYIWKQNSNVTSSTITTSFPLFQPIAGASTLDSADYGWAFWGFGNSQNSSNIYTNDTRYKEVYLDTPDGDGAIVEMQPRNTATKADYNNLISNESTDHIRIEIGHGASIYSHNWYSPCLKGCYLKSNGKLYKILDNVEANVIDVSLKSVDGSGTLNVVSNQRYSIINQYAWMVTENYFQSAGVTADITGVFDGTIVNVSESEGQYTATIECKPIQRIMTLVKGGVSLLTRYTTDIGSISMAKMYDSINSGWKMITRKGQYSVNTIVFQNGFNLNPILGQKFTISVLLTKGASKPTIGQNAYMTLDTPYEVNYPYTSKSGFSLNLSATPGLVNGQGVFITSDVLCLDGEYFSPPYLIDIPMGSRIGVTGGYLFGMEINGSAESSMGAVILVTTLRASRGLASLFHILREEDWVVYQDVNTKKITVRKGCLSYKEYPSKEEIVMGGPKYIQGASVLGGSEIKIDVDKDRVRRITVEVENLVAGQPPSIMFGVGDPNNVYGFLVSGDGLVDLQTLRLQGITSGSLPSSAYTDSNGQPVSPVYSYKKCQWQNSDKVYVDMGIDTDEESIFIKDGNIKSAVVQYIDNQQSLENDGVFDVVRLSDGEIIFLYGQTVRQFNLASGDGIILNNSSDNSTKWFSSTGVLALGSYRDSYFWGTPSVAKSGNNDLNTYQYPSMLINSVEYLSCIYNATTDVLNIFVRAYTSNSFYVGCLQINAKTLNHKIYKCSPLNSDGSASTIIAPFFYRPQLLENSFVADVDKSWISNAKDIINDGFIYSRSDLAPDEFIRIMGSGITKSQVTYADEPGVISTSILSDGTYILLYDTKAGIKALYSTNQGGSWASSRLNLTRSGRCGLLLERYLFYITTSGIEIKYTQLSDFSDDRTITMKNAEGINVTSTEISKQAYFDKLPTSLIMAEPIEYQRLSGYITPDGIIKVFFYDSNRRLKCIESIDSKIWTVADNF